MMGDKQRFEHYLDYLRAFGNVASRNRYTVIQFYRGHFYQQLANHSISKEFARQHQEKALCYYQTYLALGAHHDESWYYVQWQAGMLQEVLHYPWIEIEKTFLKATSIDPLRGEANKRIVQHYIRGREWKKAYHYSLIAKERFLDKNPVAQRRWFVDFDAYDWNILRAHRVIMYKLGLLKEKNVVNGTASPQTISQQGRL